MVREWRAVKTFHFNNNFPIARDPQQLSQARVNRYGLLFSEQIFDFFTATTAQAQAVIIIRIIYTALRVLVELGISPQKLFNAEHKQRMTT